MNEHDVQPSSGLGGRWSRALGRGRIPGALGSGGDTVFARGRAAVGPAKPATTRGRRFLAGAIGAVVLAVGLATVATAPMAQAETTGVLGIDHNRRYDANTYLGSHNSFAAQPNGWTFPNQDSSVYEQLEKGVRVLNFDVYVGRQDVGWGCVEIYQDQTLAVGEGEENMEHCDNHLGGDPVVFTAHRPVDLIIGGYFLHPAKSFDELNDELNPVHEWMMAHPREIVTMVFENHVHADHQDLIDNELAEAGFFVDHAGCAAGPPTICVFDPRPQFGNTGFAVPGRPGAAWSVTRDGFPTLNQMADANYRFVLFRQDSDNTVRTNDNDVMNQASPDTWADTRADTPAIDDFTRPILLVEHIPFTANLRPVGGPQEVNFNGEERVFRHWDDIEDRWRRMPQIIWFDFVDQDGEHLFASGDPSNPTGAMQLVAYLNHKRGTLAQISAAGTVAGANQAGWNRSDAKVTYAASGDTARTWVRNSYGAEITDLRANCVDGMAAGNCLASDTVHAEGRTTVSFAAVGNSGLGIRSNQAYVEVKIDKTQPDIVCTGNAGTYLADQPVAISCSATDQLSGVQPLSRSTITGLAGELGVGAVAVPVRATDNADNVRDLPVTFTVIVTFDSLRNLTERYVTDKPLHNVLVNKLDAAKKVEAAGNTIGKAQLLASYVQHVEKNTGRLIDADRAAVLIRLAQAL